MRKKLVFIVIIIFILAVFVQCSREYSEPLSSEMARELALLPPSAAGLGYLNIKAVKESPFFSMVEENLEENPFYSDDYQECVTYPLSLFTLEQRSALTNTNPLVTKKVLLES